MNQAKGGGWSRHCQHKRSFQVRSGDPWLGETAGVEKIENQTVHSHRLAPDVQGGLLEVVMARLVVIRCHRCSALKGCEWARG